MRGDITQEHYDRIAGTFNENWSYSPEFTAWLVGRITQRLRVGPGDRVIDVGCGTGLYARSLAAEAHSVVCVDPSGPMLAQLPRDARLIPRQASAEELCSGEVSLPHDGYDAMLIKEVLHHLADPAAVLGGLVPLLRPGGRLLVVLRPRRLDYPLFAAALRRFHQMQPDPDAIAEVLRGAGLRTELSYGEFLLTFSTERYVQMVRDRYMTLLSSFTDEELETGIAEIRQTHTGPRVQFTDRIAFILGEQP